MCQGAILASLCKIQKSWHFARAQRSSSLNASLDIHDILNEEREHQNAHECDVDSLDMIKETAAHVELQARASF